jgi:hypothetical protein
MILFWLVTKPSATKKLPFCLFDYFVKLSVSEIDNAENQDGWCIIGKDFEGEQEVLRREGRGKGVSERQYIPGGGVKETIFSVLKVPRPSGRGKAYDQNQFKV